VSGAAWVCIEAAAGMLTPCEREWVLGDLEEAERGAWRALADVLGLVGRRQIALWNSWRPWLAAFGLALPCSFLLMGFSLAVTGEFRHIRHAQGVGLALLLGKAALLAICAWSAGFTASGLSRRTLWASAGACLVPCFFCLSRFGLPDRSPLELVVFVPLAIWGAWLGYKGIRLKRRATAMLAVAATLLAAPGLVSSGLASPEWTGAWISTLVLLWPAWFVAMTGRVAAAADG
jgi:hypothetical protein